MNLLKVSQYYSCFDLILTTVMTAKPLVKKGENSKPIMYNPLAWWYRQQLSGHEQEGTMQMVIDVLSTPGRF